MENSELTVKKMRMSRVSELKLCISKNVSFEDKSTSIRQ